MPAIPFTAHLRRRRSLVLFVAVCLGILLLTHRASIDLTALGPAPIPEDSSPYDYDSDTDQLGSPTPHNDTLPLDPLVQDDPSKPLTTTPPDAKLCKPEECAQGRWTPRDPPLRSLADFQALYPPSHRGIFKLCGSEENAREEHDREMFHKFQEERLLGVMNWVWKPERGDMIKWNADEFVVRLLQSPGGLIFSGDSISRQQFQYLEYALARAGVHISEDPPHLPHYDHHRLHQFILKPGDAMTNFLREKAGVPESRLRRPIYTKMDNHILIGEKDVREITGKLGAKEDFRWFDIFDYFEDWENFLADMAKSRPGEEDTVTKDTVVVMNTGAHWSRGSFYMLPNSGTVHDQQARVTKAFSEMINRIITRLSPIPQLSIFYRATASGHPGCTSKISPYANITEAREWEGDVIGELARSTDDENQSVIRQRWDWDRLDVHNRLWERRIGELGNGNGNGKSNAKWAFLDVWSMTVQRPDAHTQNLVDPKNDNYDCLHWCVPGMVEQWTELLNHWLFWTPEME